MLKDISRYLDNIISLSVIAKWLAINSYIM